ncbi:MAG TPA: ABC transporter ATP-binding protein [Gemmatimonadaceae bacterium]|jgi:ABC-type multidrug transport system ATPase subunit|nr:ABC transporter ATP-binding protein [Gemmatimonadaceae bacterium]
MTTASPPAVALTLEGVTKRFRNGVVAVNDVSLALGTGVLALLGPNGAGKTTLMQMIATITKPSAGRILFDGEDIARDPDLLRRRLGYLPQDFGVYDGLTALDFLTYFAALKGIHSRARVTEMLELVNLHAVADRAVGGFSGGMKQRLGIAQALINDPALLIVDEPTAGLDPEERLRFRNILSDIGFERLVIFSTHIVSDIESIATEIAVMKSGRLLTTSSPPDFLRAAAGSVWEVLIPLARFDEERKRLRIARSTRTSDGVLARIVHTERPVDGATSVEPDLEDAFIFALNFGASAA